MNGVAVSIDPLNPVGHLGAAQRLSRGMSSSGADAASSVAAASDPYAQMRANPLKTVESIQPSDPAASVRPEFAERLEQTQQKSQIPEVSPDDHVQQPTVTDRSLNIGQASVEEFEKDVVRKQRLEGALDIRQATSGRLGAMYMAEQRPDMAPVAMAMAAYQPPVAANAGLRRVEAVQAGQSNRPYGQENATAKYKRVAKGPSNSSILEGAPNLEVDDDFDTVAGVMIPRVGLLK